MLSDRVINTVIAAAAGVFFTIVISVFRAAGADIWAAIVLALASVALLLAASGVWANRRQ